jgi:N-methylhydantoinase A
MGGTSADFSLLDRGRPTWTTEATINGLPLALPVVDVESVGAGGGSLAWVDAGGALRVGPESAGADPGPIAYGKGGMRVTVTDADLVGGVLGPTLLDGHLALEVGLARKGIEGLAADLGLSPEATILGIQSVVRASMAKAMRLVLARRGVDSRDFALMAFGGAGPMHAWALARELGVGTVVVPYLPGAFSAYGILISPVRQEYSRTVIRTLVRSARAIEECIDAFRDRAKADLLAQGFASSRAILEPSVDLRFHGQSYEINIPLQTNLGAAFRQEHRRRFGYASRSASIELVAVRLSARIPRPMVRPRLERRTTRGRRERRVLFEDGWSVVPVRDRSSLEPGLELDGPIIIAEAFATTLVPPGARVEIDRLGLLRIEVDA